MSGLTYDPEPSISSATYRGYVALQQCQGEGAGGPTPTRPLGLQLRARGDQIEYSSDDDFPQVAQKTVLRPSDQP